MDTDSKTPALSPTTSVVSESIEGVTDAEDRDVKQLSVALSEAAETSMMQIIELFLPGFAARCSSGVPQSAADTSMTAAAGTAAADAKEDEKDQPFLRAPVVTYYAVRPEVPMTKEARAVVRKILVDKAMAKTPSVRAGTVCSHIDIAEDGHVMNTFELVMETPPVTSKLPLSHYAFKLEKRMGHGSECVVFLARRLSDNAFFAMKYVYYDADRGIIRGLQGAVELRRILMLLEGDGKEEPPFIAPVHAMSITTSMKLLIRTPLYVGGTLYAHRGKGVDFARVVMFQLLTAIEYMHSHDVAHLDIRPHNVMLESVTPPVIRLIDFGLAKRFIDSKGRIPMEFEQVTAAYYRAPEVFREDCEYTEAVDIWSIGCVFFELIMMKHMFGDTLEVKEEQVAETRCFYEAAQSDARYDRCTFVSIVDEFKCGQEGAQDFANICKSDKSEAEKKRPHIMPVMLHKHNTAPRRYEFLRQAGADAHDLLCNMLTLNPDNRPSAYELLQHRFFTATPPAIAKATATATAVATVKPVAPTVTLAVWQELKAKEALKANPAAATTAAMTN